MIKTIRLFMVTLAVVSGLAMLTVGAHAVEGALPDTSTPDQTAPTTSVDGLAVYCGDGAITIGASDAAPGWGVAYIGYRLDGGSARLYNATGMASDSTAVPIPRYVAGTHTLDYWAQDRAGNVSAVQRFGFQVKLENTLTFAAPTVSAFAQVPVYGQLMDLSGGPLAHKTVNIMGYAGGWTPIATVVTGFDGTYATTLAPTARAEYKAYWAGDGTYGERTSGPQTVLPKVRIKPTSTGKTAYLNRTYYATGYVEPGHSTSDPNKVTIRAYRKGSDGVYRYKTSFKSKYVYYSANKTTYKAAVKFTNAKWKGSWKLMPYHAADAANASTFGAARYITLK